MIGGWRVMELMKRMYSTEEIFWQARVWTHSFLKVLDLLNLWGF